MRTLFEKEARSLRPMWPIQVAGYAKLRDALREGHKRIIFQAPTGFGKTLLAAHIVDAALRKGNRPLFTCPAISLVEQTLAKFEAEGIDDIGIMQADHHRTDRNASLQIASVQTLLRREAPDSTFALIDEVHEEWDGLYSLLDSEQWKNRLVIGLSATPWKKGMGHRWTKLVVAATINDLIAAGHATPARIYAPPHDVDRGAVKVVRGEFEEQSAASAMSQATIVGDVIEEWKEHSTHEKTFAFCHNRAHAQAQMQAFQDCGIPFGYIDAYTPVGRNDTDPGTRLNLFAQMRNGIIAGIASVGCLIRGVDEDVRTILDLQMTRSEIRHVQKWGRGVRCAAGKDHLVGIDCAGNNIALGLFTDIHHDHLDTGKDGDRNESYWDDDKPAKPRKCPKCGAILSPMKRACANCGERVERPTGVTVVDGKLVELGHRSMLDRKMKQAWYSGFLWVQNKRGYKPGWATFTFQEKFGHKPSDLQAKKRKPGDELMDYVNAKIKAYRAERKAAEEYHGEF